MHLRSIVALALAASATAIPVTGEQQQPLQQRSHLSVGSLAETHGKLGGQKRGACIEGQGDCITPPPGGQINAEGSGSEPAKGGRQQQARDDKGLWSGTMNAMIEERGYISGSGSGSGSVGTGKIQQRGGCGKGGCSTAGTNSDEFETKPLRDQDHNEQPFRGQDHNEQPFRGQDHNEQPLRGKGQVQDEKPFRGQGQDEMPLRGQGADEVHKFGQGGASNVGAKPQQGSKHQERDDGNHFKGGEKQQFDKSGSSGSAGSSHSGETDATRNMIGQSTGITEAERQGQQGQGQREFGSDPSKTQSGQGTQAYEGQGASGQGMRTDEQPFNGQGQKGQN